MSSLTSKALLNKLRNHKTKDNDGFTLVELLVVVIIVGILSSVALPAFLNQAAKAKIASAKSLAGSGSKECQSFMVDNTGTWELTTNGSDGITFPAGSTTGDTAEDGECTAAEGGEYRALIKDSTEFIATVTSSGRVNKSCIVTAAAVTAATAEAGGTLTFPTTIAGCNFETNTTATTGTW